MGVWLSRRRKRIWRWDEEVVRPLSWRLLLLKRRPYSIVDRVGSSRVETSMYVLLFVNLQGRDSGQPVLLLQESLTSKGGRAGLEECGEQVLYVAHAATHPIERQNTERCRKRTE